ncbi:hypothetical protein [Polaribacter sp.]|uniref:hypothetical protein n=1 Tax=Polaribacter sp. TaxID=1920175 RepID=UPI003EF5C469
MKKGILLVVGMLMMVSTATAKNGTELLNNSWVNYSYDNSVNFVERGVEFFVFTNGEFDFDTHYNDTYYDYNGNRRSVNNVSIQRDYRGRINRIGNVFVNYDYRGNVSKIGNVFISYYRGRLTNVGNLRVQYDRGGYPQFYGYVKDNFHVYNGIRVNLNIGTVHSYNDVYFYGSDFSRNYSQIREDTNFYYYRAKPNAKIGKRSTILKRRKPASIRTGKTITHRKSNNTYRKPASSKINRKVVVEKRNNNNSNRNSSTTRSNGKKTITRGTTTYRKPATVNSTRKSSTRKTTIENKNNRTSTRKPATTITRKATPRKVESKTEKVTRQRRS